MSEAILNVEDILREKLDEANLAKLTALPSTEAHKFVAQAISHCKPESVFVRTDSAEDEAYIRNLAIEDGSEKKLNTKGHTIHFDGYNDQARDKANTKYLLAEGQDLGSRINSVAKSEGLPEVMDFLEGAMAGKQMIVCFHCLGPTNSQFSIPVMQVTDSSYVAHSLVLLYRPGYEQFKSVKDGDEFFRVMHSQGELISGDNDAPVSKNIDKRRVYIDLDENIVYSVNTQYAGNTVGLKKLSLRLALRKAAREGWLSEHMFLTAVPGSVDGRWTYFSGAFPSACGKTSTAMIPGQRIVGDDLAYLRNVGGKIRAVNVESGIFGIIENVCPQDDPVIYETLTTPGEIIFSNVLNADGVPAWLGMGKELPKSGVNHYGNWTEGMTDDKDNPISASHKNARYTIKMSDLSNTDPIYEDPNGVELGAIVYGGRDSDTHVPVTEAFGWEHGVLTMGASLESETTAATLGAQGKRVFNIMSNLDFLSMSLGQYIKQYMDFAAGIDKVPNIYGVNYFLKKDGKYLNGILDKKVWILWAERRVHGEVDAIEGPTGRYPLYEDLAKLFKEAMSKEYTKEQYVEQFTIRVPELIAKNERIVNIYKTDAPDTPEIFFKVMAEQRARLEKLRSEKGDYVSPFDLA